MAAVGRASVTPASLEPGGSQAPPVAATSFPWTVQSRRDQDGIPTLRGKKEDAVGLITDVRVRQPANEDLVGPSFVVARVGAGFEGTIGMRLLDPQGKVIGAGSAQSKGGGTGAGEYSATFEVDRAPRAGTRCMLEVFGDNPGLPDEGRAPDSTLGG